MMSTSNRDEALSYTHPSSSSSPITLSDSYLQDPTATSNSSRSASGSLQNDALLGGFDAGSGGSSDAEFNFSRSEFRQNRLAGTVELYDRHVFLCYKNPRAWPTRIEAAEFDRLPRLLSAAVVARKIDMNKETRLTICEGHDGVETSNGDVLIFPDMIRYRRLTHFDVDTFVEEVLVKEGEWMPGTPEKLKGSYVFVCSHGSRDRRCGVCGPALVTRFKEEIESHGLQGKVSVSPCSHIGGHKYAGNVIIFGSNVDGEVSGHWYGYVTPDDVPILLEQHILKGEVIDLLWRGQMGLSEEAQMKSQELRLQMNGGINVDKDTKEESTQTQPEAKNPALCNAQAEIAGCCQENGKSCCQNSTLPEYVDYGAMNEMEAKVNAEKRSIKKQLSRNNSLKGARTHKVCTMPTYFETWEREDTYAALSVICAAVSVGVAYTYYKQLR